MTVSRSWTRVGLAIAVLALGPVACARRPSCPPNVKPAPLDFSLKDMNGARVTLSSYLGRPLIVNFWATWCGPCKQEIPALVDLTTKYQAQHLTVLGVSIDDTPNQLKPFVAEYKMNYPVLVGKGHDDLFKAYDAEFGIPVSWFVTSQGCIADSHLGAMTKDDFDRQAQALF